MLPQTDKMYYRDFPSGPLVKDLPSSAGDMGSIPGRGTKIPHAAGQLSPRATSTELACLNKRACVPQTTESMRSGVRVPQLERENSHATTREKPTHSNKRYRMLQLRPDADKNKERKRRKRIIKCT